MFRFFSFRKAQHDINFIIQNLGITEKRKPVFSVTKSIKTEHIARFF